MARILAIVPDLMLGSRAQESLRASGHEVLAAQALPAPGEVDAIVCDLDAVDADEVAATGLPTLGFYSHVDAATRQRGEEAGLTLIVPRSRMARELPQLVERLLS